MIIPCSNDGPTRGSLPWRTTPTRGCSTRSVMQELGAYVTNTSKRNGRPGGVDTDQPGEVFRLSARFVFPLHTASSMLGSVQFDTRASPAGPGRVWLYSFGLEVGLGGAFRRFVED